MPKNTAVKPAELRATISGAMWRALSIGLFILMLAVYMVIFWLHGWRIE